MYEYRAKTVRVIDGDTIVAKIDIGFHLTTKVTLRLLGIDTPEIRGHEKEHGLKVKAYAINLLFNDHGAIPITVKTEKTGSFGRWLAHVTFEDGETMVCKIRKHFPEIG